MSYDDVWHYTKTCDFPTQGGIYIVSVRDSNNKCKSCIGLWTNHEGMKEVDYFRWIILFPDNCEGYVYAWKMFPFPADDN